MNQISVVLGVMNFHFIGGSMGSVIGEIVSRSIKLSEEKKSAVPSNLLFRRSKNARRSDITYAIGKNYKPIS